MPWSEFGEKVIRMTTIAVGYVAFGSRYLREAERSAKSIRAVSGQIPIVVVTDQSVSAGVFDNVIAARCNEFTFADKIAAITRLPGDRILFLDCDTLVLRNVTPMFELLDRFELCAAHSSWRFAPSIDAAGGVVGRSFAAQSIPSPFCDFNTGVLLYRNAPRFQDLLRRWGERYNSHRSMLPRPPNEQAAFREVVWESDLSVYALTPEFNFRGDFPSCAAMDVVIFHGRHDDRELFIEMLSRSTFPRILDPYSRTVIESVIDG